MIGQTCQLSTGSPTLGSGVALSLPVGASDLERNLGPTAAQMGVLHLFLRVDDFRDFSSVLPKHPRP